ncbi:MAG: hypothetical protein NC098_01600 [Lachnoclostridium sp.]|nr:hypothetical protein [Lachnoclostridium sp.]
MINTANDTLFIKYETSSPNTEIRLDGSNISIYVAVWNSQNLRYVSRNGVNLLELESYTKNKKYIDLFIKYISSWNLDQIKKDSDIEYNVLGVSSNCKITRVIFHKGKIKTSTIEYEFIGFDKGSTVMGTKMDKTIIFRSFLDEVIIPR